MWTLKIEADAVIQDPSPACALTSRGGDFLAVSSVPDASVKISQRLPAPWSLLLNIWRRPGPCCGASVGTSGSAPCARACRPWSVGIAKYLNAKRTKLNKTQQNSDLPAVTESDQIWMEKQQNSAKLGPTCRAQKRPNLNAKTAKLSKTRTYLPSSKAIKSERKSSKTQQNSEKLGPTCRAQKRSNLNAKTTKLNKTEQNSPCRPP